MKNLGHADDKTRFDSETGVLSFYNEHGHTHWRLTKASPFSVHCLGKNYQVRIGDRMLTVAKDRKGSLVSDITTWWMTGKGRR